MSLSVKRWKMSGPPLTHESSAQALNSLHEHLDAVTAKYGRGSEKDKMEKSSSKSPGIIVNPPATASPSNFVIMPEPFKLTKDILPSLEAKTIDVRALHHLSALYPQVLLACPQQKRHYVSPEELERLDTLRYRTIPDGVATRYEQKFGKSAPSEVISKPELQDLMKFKLARGVYRAQLPSLIASNSDESVLEVTKNAFKIYDKSTRKIQAEKVEAALKQLTELKGVGPATASLLLAVADPFHVPFFSDELFYWTAATSNGVKLEKIKYNMKEYMQVLEEVWAIQDRLEKDFNDRPPADAIEKAAFVIQKLQNPDIWEATFKDHAEEDDHANKVRPVRAAQLDEAAPPTSEKPELSEKEKREEIAIKKKVLADHGANIKSTGKRLRPADDQPTPRRSTRTKR